MDTPLLVETDDGGNHVVIIESQSQEDETRRRSWPYYISYLNNKFECPVTLLVITADEKTAAWARKPIRVGLPQRPSLVVTPLVLAPDNVPAVRDPTVAGQDVMMAVLSVLTHRKEPQVGDILKTLAVALDKVELDTAAFLATLTEVGLGDSRAAQIWRALMTTTAYPHLMPPLRRLWREEGRLEEAGTAVLRVLQARGITISGAVETRVREQTDIAALELLLTRAVTVARAEDLFEG